MQGCERMLHQNVGFPLGVKVSHSATTVPEGGVWYARNVRGRDMGILRTRPGTKVHTDLSGPGRVRMLEHLGDRQLLAYSDNLYRLEPGTGWTLLTTGFVTSGMSDRFDSVHWQMSGSPRLYVFTGEGVYHAAAGGITLTTPYTPVDPESSNLLEDGGFIPGEQDLSSPIALSTVATMKFGMQMRAACAYENRVYLSAPSNPTYWPVEQVIYLPDDGDDVVALAVWFDVLIIFRRNDIWAFLGEDVMSNDAKLVRQAQIGCVARDSVAEVPGVGLFFLGSDNVYALTGVDAISERVQVAPVGNDIQPLVRLALENSGAVDACAIYHNGEYLLSLGNYGGGDRMFIFQTSPAPAWFVDTGPQVTYWMRRQDELYSMAGTPSGLQHHSYDYRTDNGLPIAVEIHFGQDKLPVYSKIRRLFLLLQGKDTAQSLKVSVAVDGVAVDVREYQVSAQFDRDMMIGDGAIELDRVGRVPELRTYEARIAMKGQFVQVVITGNTAQQTIAVAGYLVEYIPRVKSRGQRVGVTKTWPV